ncbi:uncharacterized protein B0H18DRAFT_1113755 [Fomitopsis serialis]|uniref:uncharacterized protein n=1 Tax=Fomitopsis serialis TaxID=139415 RepID=UPI0020087EBF|nr:uncharacterized protein B0H18DRAFT_1113755 [Neoantrodia serialis]KAH9936352.1 hypothetical protein B0H18DRAFT_1113755 [Neoantrodia serialis]
MSLSPTPTLSQFDSRPVVTNHHLPSRNSTIHLIEGLPGTALLLQTHLFNIYDFSLAKKMPMRSRSSSCSSDHAAEELDSISNYAVHEEIARGTTSVVYRATCKRGRLRNRQVALKKTSNSKLNEASEDRRNESTALHQTLHHPGIVTLFSEFSTPSDKYQVLEYCPRGSLSSLLRSRCPSVLSEEELRGIVKSLVHALTYLRKQRVLHGDINPDNTLLTDDLRAKLSCFGQAVRLPTMNPTVSMFRQTNAYTAPEIISHSSHGFSVDIWSLGCLMLTCLTGTPSTEAFFAANAPHVPLPTLEISSDPNRRIPLHRILSHAFFEPTLNVEPFTRPPPPQGSDKENEMTPRPIKQSKYPALLSKGAPPSRGTFSDRQPEPAIGRTPLTDTRNRDLRRVLSDELSESAAPSAVARRFASAPQSSSVGTKALRFLSSQSRQLGIHSIPTTPALTDDTASVASGEDITYDEDIPQVVIGKHSGTPGIGHPLLSRPQSVEGHNVPHPTHKARIGSQSSQERTAVGSGAPSIGQRSRTPSTAVVTSKAPIPRQERRTVSAPRVAPPVPHSASETISTAYLSPQTHKVAHGQLVILPSKSLLVDFREGDRRRGKKGNEVLLISPDGDTIHVYSAPHLSTPCCLAEPLATYALSGLPEAYRKAYEDANRLVNQLKQRIPQLVLYKPDHKCILMANEPLGDIELTFGRGPLPDSLKATDPSMSNEPHMRITLRRRRQAVEIARFIPSAHTEVKAGTGEWIRKVLPLAMNYLCVSEDTLAALEPGERDGLEQLARFLRLCEALETQERELRGQEIAADTMLQRAATSEDDNDSLDEHGVKTHPENGLTGLGRRRAQSQTSTVGAMIPDDEDGTLATMATRASSSSASVLPSIELAPRPSKFSTGLQSRLGVTNTGFGSHTSSSLGFGSARPPTSLPVSCAKSGSGSMNRLGSNGSSDGHGNPETRFIASIGWCMRTTSCGLQSYKLMLQDGATLAVDVSETGEDVWYAKSPRSNPTSSGCLLKS